ncbi:NAD(+) synthase [Haloarcula onubensis]|uniref:NH(3)-dependent NAD(+) synthetase n=1 Tax=Haloarcula onubensis TaxID=2950539 RepID=A0ABU2FTK7_9EURY|nr:NAD(+) synthase [Halomicroarcula sp. S3CR25-11]MDS0283622.1 NAD(+) synthase [Halomicroarcula sp. S3CR25-11]
MTADPQRHASPFIHETRDAAAVESTVRAFLRERVDAAGADGVVVAMSGGLDSTVTATLAVQALGPDRVLGLGLPCHKTDASATMAAEVVADHLDIEFRRGHLQPLLRAFEQRLAPALSGEEPRGPTPTPDRALHNAIARLRLCCSYYAANRRNRLVVGTANRSELLLGYVTKYGDGAADVFPLGGCYKTEVRALAEHLGLPDPIVEREPTTGRYPGETDADDLGATYDVVDSLLYRVVEEGDPVDAAATELGVEVATARRLVSMCVETAHKRAMPPIADVGGRSHRPTVGE